MRARYATARKALRAVVAKMDATEPEDLNGADMAKLRQVLTYAGQCFHEFNAYRNVLLTD